MKIIFDSEEQKKKFFDGMGCPGDLYLEEMGCKCAHHDCSKCWGVAVEVEVKESEE